jgi:hypothetical protein
LASYWEQREGGIPVKIPWYWWSMMDCRRPTWEPEVEGYQSVGDRRGEYLSRSKLPKGRTLVIRLKRIYNFYCSMLVYTPFALCFVTLRGVFMHFIELTY